MAEAALIAGGTVLSGVLGARGAEKAAETQAGAAKEAGQLQAQQFAETKEQLMPFIHMGQQTGQVDPSLLQEEKRLQDLISKTGGGLMGVALGQLYNKQLSEVQSQIEAQRNQMTGTTPLQQQLAMAGVLGPQAQAQIYKGYQESPEVQFLREQGMQAINQQAAATGRLGSSSRLRALSELNQQLAQQGIAQQFNRLGALSGMQLGAAQSLGGFGAQSAGVQGQAIQAAGAAQAAGQSGKYGALGQTVSQLGALGGMASMGAFKSPMYRPQTDYSIPMTSFDLG